MGKKSRLPNFEILYYFSHSVTLYCPHTCMVEVTDKTSMYLFAQTKWHVKQNDSGQLQCLFWNSSNASFWAKDSENCEFVSMTANQRALHLFLTKIFWLSCQNKYIIIIYLVTVLLPKTNSGFAQTVEKVWTGTICRKLELLFFT
jgi:hypothetical protein